MKRKNRAREYMPRQVLNRHWLWVFLWTAAGIVLSRSAGTMGLALAAIAGISGGIVLYAPVPLARRSYIGVALLFLALGAFLYGMRKPDSSNDAVHQYALSYPTQRMYFEGVTANTRVYHKTKDYLSFELDVDAMSVDGVMHPYSGKAQVRWSRPNTPVFSGSRVRVYGRLSPHISVTNHGVRGLEDSYRAHGVFSVIHATGNSVAELQPGYFTPRYWAARLRQWQSESLAAVTPKEVHSFINGVWLGERSLITQEEYEQFVHAGTAHVLAVSGVHVAIIALSLNFVLRMSRMSRHKQLLFLMAGIVLFAMMTGARTATLRAALMLMLYFAYEWVDREPDSLSVLGLCGFGFLVWNPNLLFDPGFLMSYGSVASILLFHPGISFFLSRLSRIPAASLATTLSVQVFTWPLAAWHFYLVPITGIVANIIVVPLLTVALWLCFVSVLISMVAPSVAMIFGYALLPVVTIIHWTNGVAGSLPLAYATLLRPSVLAMLLYAVAVLYFYRVLYDEKMRRHNLVVMMLLLIVVAVFWRPASQGAQVDFIDVGNGDSIFVRTPGGTTLLVDGGDASEFTDAGERAVLPFLYANGVSRLDYVVVSHSDRDHIGGLFHVVKHIPVETVILGPEQQQENKLEQAFLDLCAEREIDVMRLSAGDAIPAEGVQINVLHPPATWDNGNNINNQSLVLRVAWDDFSLLLPGDVEEAAEQLLATSALQPVSVLKVPHHGSATSSSEPFLDQIAPDVAVVSVRPVDGRGSFMPTRILERYTSRNIPLFRTDWHGGIRIRPHNGNLLVNTARGDRGYTLEPVGE